MQWYWPIIIVLLSSCGSGSSKKKLEAFPDIENSDFRAKKPVRYNSSDDYFQRVDSNDSLVYESINRIDSGKLDDIEFPTNPISQAISLCYQRKFSKSFKILDSIYDKYKKHPSYWNQIATCYYLQGNNNKAMLYYNKALDIKPKYAPAINNLGVLYMRESKDQKAFVAFNRAVKYKPSSFTPKFNLAQLYMEYGLFDKAIRYFRILHKNNHRDTDVLSGIGSYYVFKNNAAEAVRIFSQIDKKYLKRADISLNYAIALKLNGNNNAAKNVFQKINSSEVKLLSSYYRRVAKFIGIRR